MRTQKEWKVETFICSSPAPMSWATRCLHFAGRLVGESHGQNLMRFGQTLGQDVGQATGEDAGLAGAGSGDNQKRAVGGGDRLALAVVEIIE